MSKDQLASVLENISKAVNTHFEMELALPGDIESFSDVTWWIPTASTMLNLFLGDGNYGVPVGRIIEVFGENSHGKSTIAQHIMNGFQAAGGVSVLIDAESGWNKERAIRMGHNTQRHIHVGVPTCESGFAVIRNLLKHFKMQFAAAKIPIVFVWDTIAASPTEGEKKGEQYESGMMYKPRLIRQELTKLTMELPENDATLVFVNQTIDGPHKTKENMSGIKTTPGGGAIKFWSSQRIQVEKVGLVTDYETKKPVGIITKAQMVKNKLGNPMKTVDLPITFSIGIDPVREVINYLLDHSNVVNIRGSYRQIVGFTYTNTEGKVVDEPITYYEKDTEKMLATYAPAGLIPWLVEQAKAHYLGLIPTVAKAKA